jgi:hypothetical protein
LPRGWPVSYARKTDFKTCPARPVSLWQTFSDHFFNSFIPTIKFQTPPRDNLLAIARITYIQIIILLNSHIKMTNASSFLPIRRMETTMANSVMLQPCIESVWKKKDS